MTTAIVFLAVLTWGATAYLVATHHGALTWLHFAPAIGMLALVAVWFWAIRPERHDACGPCRDCGTVWRSDEGSACPACTDVA